MSDQVPSAAGVPPPAGVKPKPWRRHLSPEEAVYVLNEGHWAITVTHRLFRHLPNASLEARSAALPVWTRSKTHLVWPETRVGQNAAT